MSTGQGEFLLPSEPSFGSTPGPSLLIGHLAFSPPVATTIHRSGSDCGSSSGLGGMKYPAAASAGSDSGSQQSSELGERKPVASSKQSAASSSGKGSSTGASPTSGPKSSSPKHHHHYHHHSRRVATPPHLHPNTSTNNSNNQHNEVDVGGSCGSVPSTSSTVREGGVPSQNESPVSLSLKEGPSCIPPGVMVTSSIVPPFGEMIPGMPQGCTMEFPHFGIPPPPVSAHPILHPPPNIHMGIVSSGCSMPAPVPGIVPPLYTMTLGNNVEVLHPSQGGSGMGPLHHQHFPPLVGVLGPQNGACSSTTSSVSGQQYPPPAFQMTRSPSSYSPSPAVPQQQNGPIPSTPNGGGGVGGGGGGGPGSSGGGSRGSTSPPAINGPPNGLPPYPCPPTVGQHAVYVHVNPGETLSVRVGNDIQHIAGPATVRMVSQNAGPPVPLPLHVPPGHIVQQIVDDQGTLKHLILSPQTPPGPPLIQPGFPMPPGPTPIPVPSPVLPPHPGYPPEPVRTPSKRIGEPAPKEEVETNNTTGSTHSGASADDEDVEKLNHMLSKILPPEILEIGPREALVQWQPLDCSEASASGGPFPYIDSSEFTYELLVSERKPDIQCTFSKLRVNNFSANSEENKKWLYNLKPSTDYFIRVRADLEDRGLKGEPSAPVGFRSKPTHPDKPQPPNLLKRGKNCVNLAWKKPCDNGAKITSYHLEMDDGRGSPEGGKFQEIYAGNQDFYRVTKLQPNTLYRLRLQANNQYGRSEYSDPLLVQTTGAPPTTPQPPHLLQATPTTLQVNWEKRAGDENFTLFMEDPSTGHGFLAAVTTPDTLTTVHGLHRNWEYRFRLVASNEDGKSQSSEVVSFRTAPSKPETPNKPFLLKDRVKPTSVRVGWEPPKDTGGCEVSGYQLEYCGVAAEGAGPRSWTTLYSGADRDFTVTSLQPGTAYKFRVSCSGVGGESGWSDALHVSTIPVPPAAPSTPSLAKSKPNSLSIKWGDPETDGGSEVIEYEVWMQPSDSQHAPLTVFRGLKTECMVGSLLPGRIYGFRVRASNQAGAGQWSETLEATTASAPPDSPLRLGMGANLSSHSLLLTWDPPSQTNGSPVTEYKLLKAVRRSGSVDIEEASGEEGRGSEPGSPHSTTPPSSTHSTNSPSSDGPSTSSNPDSDFGHFTIAYTGPALSHEVKNLVPATDYAFRVSAVSAAGTGPASEILVCRTCPGAPDPPARVLLEPLSTTQLRVGWDVPSENGSTLTGYQLKYGPMGDGEGSAPSYLQLPAHVNECVLEDLEPETTYKIRVGGLNDVGEGLWSSGIRGSTFSKPPPPPTVELVSGGHNSLKLRWSDTKAPVVSENYNYSLEMENKSGTFSPIFQGQGKTHKVPKLLESTSYRFRIRATSSTGGTGPWSEPVVFQTSLAPPPPIKSPVKVTQVRDCTWQVEWSGVKASSLPTGDKINYRLQLSTRVSASPTASPSTSDQHWKTVYQGPAQSYTLTSLTAGVPYRVRVVAVRLSPATKEEEKCTVETYGIPQISEVFSKRLNDISPEGPSETSGNGKIEPEEVEEVAERTITDTQWALIMLAGFSIIAMLIAFAVQWFINAEG